MAKRILITGASGMIGQALTELLLRQGHMVVHLGRLARQGTVPSFVWDIDKQQIDLRALEGIDVIVNLAGANVGERRWTPARKREIGESRTKSSRLLVDVLKKHTNQVRTFVAASAIGFYGYASDEVRNEESPAGTDFLAQVTRHWEEEADKVVEQGIRLVKLRIGIVLSNTGGALMEMARPVRWLVGSPLGSGSQYLTWIHLEDLCRIFQKAIEDERMAGTYNAVGPEWVTNREMTRAIANALHKPLWMPAIPGFVLRAVIGEMADIVLTGARVSSEKIQEAGFEFRFKRLDQALSDLLS